MAPFPKKPLFLLSANLMGLLVALAGLEFAVRWSSEHGFAAAWRSFFSGAAPFSDLRTGSTLVADPDLGYRFNPSQPGVNSLGLRNPEIPSSKPPGLLRLIVLGDSVAAPPDGFAGILREHLQGVAEVINAAIPGYTTYQERKLLERDLLPLGPDLVLLVYCLNDNHQFLHRFDAQQRMLFTEEARRTLAPTEGGIAYYLVHHSYLALRLRLAMLQLGTVGGSYPWEHEPDVAVAWQDASWNMFREHVKAMRGELGRSGARLAVVMAPYRPQFDPKLLSRDSRYVLKPQRIMEDICASEGLPLLDLYQVMAGKGGGGLFIDNYHFNRAGHQVVAESLLEFLAREDLVAPPAARRTARAPR